MPPNLLWHSNSPYTSTGYGSQTALFCDRLKDQYNLGISAFYGLEGSPLRWHDTPMYPGIGGTYGNETIQDHATVHFDGDLRNGLVVTLMDVWVLDPAVWRRMNVACWTPVDHDPLPSPIYKFFDGSQAVPVAMSRFGETKLRDAGLDPLYVPHGVDCDVYRPYDKRQARKRTGMPEDAFIVGMVAANKGNPSRKCFHEAFAAFKLLHDQHPEARLYLHTELLGRFDGVHLPTLIDHVGLSREAVMFADQYRVVHYPFPPEKMAQVFSAFDVLLAPSAGEGFGIPVIEAQACGVPVIVSDFSAQPELVGAGWIVSGQPVYTPLKAFQFRPDIPDIHDALRRAYATARNSLMDKARGFAEQYHVDRVMSEFMLPALEQARGRFESQDPVVIEPRLKAAA